MSLPSIDVGVALGVAQPGDFIIGDNPRGIIGSTEYTVASGFVPVTADAYAISISRGRFTRLWDSFEAGRCQVSLWNMDRDYDPAHLAGPYAGFITPGRNVCVKAAGLDVFTGFVEDWDLQYEVDGRSEAVLSSTDALGMFGQLQFTAWTSTSTSAGGKLTAICERSEVAWPATLRDFDEGVEALQSDAVSWGSNVLNYAALIARSEIGYLYADPHGVLKFRDRNVAVGATPAVYFSDTSGTFESVLYDDSGEPLLDGDGLPLTGTLDVIGYQGITATVGSETLFARVGVDREGGTNQTATVADTTSWIETNGPLRSLSIPQLLLADDTQSLALAEYLLSLYDTARYRVSELRVDITPLTTAQQQSVLELDITDMVAVEFTPNGIGDPITQNLVIQGVRHDVGVERHTVTFSLIDAPVPAFRIGDAVMGVIGNTTYLIGF